VYSARAAIGAAESCVAQLREEALLAMGESGASMLLEP